MSAYVSYLCFTDWEKLPKPFKIGIVGGLGPAATVDLYDKITKATPAKNDQEHIKVAVEQNPRFLTVPNTCFTAAWIPHFLCMPLAASSRKMRLTQS